MTLEGVKKEIMEQRSRWIKSMIETKDDYAIGKVEAFDYVLGLLGVVKDGKK